MNSRLVLFIIFTCSIAIIYSCKAKKETNDPTQLELYILAELEDGTNPKRIQKEMSQYAISDIKATDKQLNNYIFKVILHGQSADELLRTLNSKEYIKSAKIASNKTGQAKNMPVGKSTKTKPIKG